jgi:thiol-disulfide isomerase/thioredoxin
MFRFDKVWTGTPWVLLLLSLALSFQLAKQSRTQRERIGQLSLEAKIPQRGMLVPEFSVARPEEEPVVVGRADTGQVQLLYYFTTTCPFCRASIPAWNELAELLEAEGLGRSLGVGLDSLDLDAYAAEFEVAYPVVRMIDRRMASYYRANRVPVTVVLDDEGRVRATRAGQLDALQADSILTYVRAMLSAATEGTDG